MIHFYEDFLKQYDAQKKVKRGVFYTPKPVVSFIVRSVHELLQKEFGLEDGLADTTTWREMAKRNKDIKIPKGVSENEPFVQILDPAVGTGTFLVEVIDVIRETMRKKWEKQGYPPLGFNKLWNDYVPKHLLPRLYGFELMMAPYAIAHMKIGLKLAEKPYPYQFGSDERARIYLTNTLEEPKDISGYFEQAAPALAREAQAANRVKTNIPTTVIIGNPPYAGLSANMNPWIDGLLKGQLPNGPKVRSYYVVDGKPLGERKLWLQDDYVKFIRYAQWRIENIQCGILGYISNHAFLDNTTFRGMRQQLMGTFPKISVLDLHGSFLKKERSPDGSPDKNVFDIQQGVSIGLFRNIPEQVQPSIYHAELWGSRENKYTMLLQNTSNTIDFHSLIPNSPYYFFVPSDDANRNEYEEYCEIGNIIPENNVGIVTARDKLTIDFCPKVLWQRVKDFLSLSDEDARNKYELGKDVRDWKVKYAKESIKSEGLSQRNIKEITYRPFDIRHIYYTTKSRGFVGQPGYKLMRHMLAGENLGLISTRFVFRKKGGFHHAFITKNIIDINQIHSPGTAQLFPLYLYPDPTKFMSENCNWQLGKGGRVSNLAPKFVNQLAERICLEFVSDGKGDLKKTFGPEDIFHYIYAVFHSLTYRERYEEFLQNDFPRLPLTSNLELFRVMTKLGGELVSLHLMESDKLNKHITKWFGPTPSSVIEKVLWSDDTVWINKSKTEGFKGVPENVWNFHIGGYQVCEKWLKDRKGRKLSADDIAHYQKIVVAMNETIHLMAEIDKTIAAHGGWPKARFASC